MSIAFLLMNRLRPVMLFAIIAAGLSSRAQTPAENSLSLLPYPKHVTTTGFTFPIDSSVSIIVDRNASPEDRFAAADLASFMDERFHVKPAITTHAAKGI